MNTLLLVAIWFAAMSNCKRGSGEAGVSLILMLIWVAWHCWKGLLAAGGHT